MKSIFILAAMMVACGGRLAPDPNPGLCPPGYTLEGDACVATPVQQQDAGMEAASHPWDTAPSATVNYNPPPVDCTKTMCVEGVGAINVCTGGLADCDVSIRECQYIATNCPPSTSVCYISQAATYYDLICGTATGDFYWLDAAGDQIDCNSATPPIRCAAGTICYGVIGGSTLQGSCL